MNSDCSAGNGVVRVEGVGHLGYHINLQKRDDSGTKDGESEQIQDIFLNVFVFKVIVPF